MCRTQVQMHTGCSRAHLKCADDFFGVLVRFKKDLSGNKKKPQRLSHHLRECYRICSTDSIKRFVCRAALQVFNAICVLMAFVHLKIGKDSLLKSSLSLCLNFAFFGRLIKKSTKSARFKLNQLRRRKKKCFFMQFCNLNRLKPESMPAKIYLPDSDAKKKTDRV